MKRFYKIVKNFATSGLNGEISSLKIRRIIFVNLFSSMGVFFMSVLGVKALVNEMYPMSMALFISASAAIAVSVYTRITKNDVIGSNFVVWIMFVLLIYIFINGGTNNTGPLWLFTYPVTALFTKGRKIGSFYTLGLLAVLVSLWMIQPFALPDYESTFIWRLFIVYFGVYSLTLIYEQVREKTNKSLEDTNRKKTELLKQVEQQAEKLKSTTEKLEKVNKELSVSNQTKDKFISIIGHDLKNPFNSIVGLSELILKRKLLQNPEKAEEILVVIYNSSKEASVLLENLLEWSKNQSNKLTIEKTVFDVSVPINNAVQLFKVMAEKKQISIDVKSMDGHQVMADAQMVNTILRNLLNNAIKYTEPGGKITIESEKKEVQVIVSIRDTGIGIPAEKLKTLFQLESFSDKGTSGESGTGLGLVLCKDFVDKHNGKIWVESNPDGNRGEKGSQFSFSLPVS